MLHTIVSKFTSARFWMALIFTVGFVWGFHEKLIAGEAFTAVVLVVVRDYFSRSRPEDIKKNGLEKVNPQN